MTAPVFFRPGSDWVGDVIPCAFGEELRLYYLLERRQTPKPGTPWNLVTTTDGVRYVDEGLAFECGDETAPDFNCYTGSIVIDDEGVQHLFYTAQNPTVVGADGQPLQLVAHATSVDGLAWVKHPEHTFGATEGYETADWRDPYVFRHPDGRWHMLIAARHTSGPERRRGVIARCVSDDLVHWRAAAPFFDPRRYIAHECPEVFEWNGWWYLVYSEFSDRFTTRYRMARSPEGPWRVPERDTLDGRGWYAAKSAALGDRRLFFGWIASRAGESDDGAWLWAGTLSTLEAAQNPDGTLAMRLPRGMAASFTSDETHMLGLATSGALRAPASYSQVISAHELPEQFHVSVSLGIEPCTTEAGLLLRCSPDGDTGYILRLEPKAGRFVLDRWPRRRTGAGQWEISGDVPQILELERPCDLAPGPHTLELLVDKGLLVAVLDQSVTLSTPLYDHPRGRLGIFAGEGCLTYSDLHLNTRI